MQQLDLRIRHHLYDVTMREGAPPAKDRLAELAQVGVAEAAESLQRLAEARMVVLQRDSGEVLMAGPFSAVPTGFRVHVNGLDCYGNCIWDALGIVATLRGDAEIETSCADCGTAARLFVRGGVVGGDYGFMHFPLPPRVWWEDVVFT